MKVQLNNRTRLIFTIFDEPWNMLSRTKNEHLLGEDIPTGTIIDPSQVQGFIADFASEIFQNKLKIPYKFVIEKTYGREIKEGFWNGLIGGLVNQSADVALAPLVITRKRSEVVDFSYPFLQSGISLMMSKPKRYKPVCLSIFLSVQNGTRIDSI